MPYSLTIKPPVMFVAWRGFSPGDLREIAERLAEMRRTSGQPAVYFARIPGEHHVFTDNDTKVLLAFLNGILSSCATVHHVIEGDGFLKSARLAFVTNLATATLRPRDFHVYGTLEEGLRAIKAVYGVDLRAPAASAVAPAPDGERKGEKAGEGPGKERRKHVPRDTPPERASAVFRGAARIVDTGRGPPRKGS
jgi:hypothetical protein